MRGIPFATRARLFEVAEMFLAKGAYDVRIEGPVAGRNIQARIRDRVPERLVALTGQITMGDEAPGRSSHAAINLVLRREGNALRGTVTATRKVPVRIELVKEGTQ